MGALSDKENIQVMKTICGISLEDRCFDVKELVSIFSGIQQAVLCEPSNLIKTHWSECENEHLLNKAHEHLQLAMSGIRTADHVLHAANFLMMVYDNERLHMKKRKKNNG